MKEEPLPNGWINKALKELVWPRGEKTLPEAYPGLKFIGMDHVEAQTGKVIGGVDATTMKSSAAVFYPGDVIYGRLRPYLNKVALPNFHGLASAEFIVIPENSSICSKYLKMRLQARDFVSFASHLNEGDRPRVNFDQIGVFEVALPPIKEQHRIVAKIEELFSELDKGIESLKTAREQLKVYRQSLLKHAFEGKLTEQWRNDNASKLETADELLARIQQEREARYQQQLEEWKKAVKEWEGNGKEGKKPGKPRVNRDLFRLFESDIEQLPSLPREWCWVTLDELVSGLPRAMQSGPFGSNLKHSEFTDTGVLVLGIDNVKDGDFSLGSQNRISLEKYTELEKYTARPGDLLVTVMASLGRTCVVPRDLEKAIITKHVYRITLEQKLLLPEFYNLLLQSHTISRIRMFESAQGQTRPGLNSGILKELPVPLCSLDEQKKIFKILEEKLSTLNAFEIEINSNLGKIESLRQSILKKAFSGQLLPQDPNDEPASELLKRIVEEKAQMEATTKAAKAATRKPKKKTAVKKKVKAQ